MVWKIKSLAKFIQNIYLADITDYADKILEF